MTIENDLFKLIESINVKLFINIDMSDLHRNRVDIKFVVHLH